MEDSVAPSETVRAPRRMDVPYVALILFSVVTAALTAIHGWRLAVDVRRDWQLFDWLIAYDAGFVRRGLSGTLIRPLSEITSLDPAVIVWAIQQAGYAVLFGGVLLMARELRPIPWPVWPLLFAPFLLTFQVLDPIGGYRKEVLALAGVAICCVATRREGRVPQVVATGAFAAVPVMLMHEGMIVYLPWLAALAGLGNWTRRRAVIAAMGSVFAGATAAGALISSATEAQAAAICGHVAEAARVSTEQACQAGNAVMLLAEDATFGTQWVARLAPEAALWLLPAMLLIGLGLVPAFWLLPPPGRRWVLGAGTAALVLSLPMFAVAIDWGRFLYVHAACGALVTLAWLRRGRREVPRLAPVPHLFVVAGTIVYAIGWNLHHFGRLVGPGVLD